METIIYSAIGLAVVLSIAVFSTFHKQLNIRWKRAALKARASGFIAGVLTLFQPRTI